MKKLRFVFVLAAIIGACSLHAQLRVAVLIVGDYNPTTLEYQWNDGILNGQDDWREFWNDAYLLWELLEFNSNLQGYGYDYIYLYFADGDIYDQGDLDLRYQVPPNAPFLIAEASLENIQLLFNGLASGIGYPLLEDDDFLFIWTLGHGGYNINGSYMNLYDGDVLTDDMFGNLVNSTTALKKVIFMQHGYAGGFANYLTGNNVIFYSACDENTNAYQADDFPYLENETLINGTYYHGEFDFHTYSPMAGKSPNGVLQYNGILYSSADADINGVVSIDEIHNWEINWTGISSVFQDPGNIAATTSIKFPNLVFEDIENNTTLSGYIGIVKPIKVISGATLTIAANSEVHFEYEGDLTIEMGATLIIDDNVDIYSDANYGLKNLTIEGNLDLGYHDLFATEPYIDNESRMNIILNNPSLNLFYDNTELRNVILLNRNASNDFYNCTIGRSDVRGYNSNYNLSGCIFELSSSMYITNVKSPRFLTMNNCTFTSSPFMIGLTVEGYSTVNITMSTFTSLSNGIRLYNCGKQSAYIRDCIINYCTGTGILSYNSSVTVASNKIRNNGYGIRSYDHNNIAIYGSCSNITQDISLSQYSEIAGSVESFPYYFKYNSIPYSIGTNKFLNFNVTGDILLNARDNKWDIANPTPYFIPQTNYSWQPVWVPGNCFKDDEIAQAIYFSVLDSIEAENYSNARSLLEQLITDYPESLFAQAALRTIFEIEENTGNSYNSLKNFFNENQIIQNNPVLKKRSDFLSAFCDVKLENWPTAIAWFEDVIQNPETFEDSIFAIIDLGYTYWLMENSGFKSTYNGTMPQYKFASHKEYEENRDYLLSLLPGDGLSETMKQNLIALNPGELLQNVPNPFSGTTQIWYKIESESMVSINVYDNMVRCIRSYDEGPKQKGTGYVEFSSEGLPGGLYFYKLVVNGVQRDSKKMTIIK
jgi:hypothetical protein